ncbi:transcription factor Spi-C [Pungitius pungitius]|uniref:transcription factor Spi-C n=1 Tax=Pungitius pungitius TaxID=134920 RepID=UPI002E116386
MASAECSTQMYKMTSLDINQHFQDAIDVIQQHSCNPYYDSECTYYETLGAPQPLHCPCSSCGRVKPPSDGAAPGCDYWTDVAQSWPQVIPDVSLGHSVQSESPHYYSVSPSLRSSKGRKKLRLYEYLHEALNDPNMGDSIQWTDDSTGTFHFISKNKEKLAECWGQRKGNRKTMTYQKMARALRNYSRTGEILKVRRKLTYQFNPDILHRLGSARVPPQALRCPEPAEGHGGRGHGGGGHGGPQSPAEQSYCGSAADWHSWYGHYPLQEDYDLASSFTSPCSAKL